MLYGNYLYAPFCVVSSCRTRCRVHDVLCLRLPKGNFTEELLARHEEELSRVKAWQERARPLLEILEKWEKTWALFQDFEVQWNFWLMWSRFHFIYRLTICVLSFPR